MQALIFSIAALADSGNQSLKIRHSISLVGQERLTGKTTITVGSVGLNGQFIDEEKRDMVDQSGADATRLEELQARLEAGEFDLVAVGRALLQDPEWVLKVQTGRLDELQSYSKASLMTLV